MAHTTPRSCADWVKILTKNFENGFPNSYNIVQYLLQHRRCASHWRSGFAEVLESTRAAYRVVDNTIVPFGSDLELAQIEAALESATALAASGSKAHLMAAAAEMTSGESIKVICKSTATKQHETCSTVSQPSTRAIRPSPPCEATQ
ncbi:hypothetical protein NTCA1_28360 [Novosphingobium sp. TCA1]|nr:hypothetical protein NTCA1_28360 [Novosphingobium sp. TCA1]